MLSYSQLSEPGFEASEDGQYCQPERMPCLARPTWPTHVPPQERPQTPHLARLAFHMFLMYLMYLGSPCLPKADTTKCWPSNPSCLCEEVVVIRPPLHILWLGYECTEVCCTVYAYVYKYGYGDRVRGQGTGPGGALAFLHMADTSAGWEG